MVSRLKGIISCSTLLFVKAYISVFSNHTLALLLTDEGLGSSSVDNLKGEFLESVTNTSLNSVFQRGFGAWGVKPFANVISLDQLPKSSGI